MLATGFLLLWAGKLWGAKGSWLVTLVCIGLFYNLVTKRLPLITYDTPTVPIGQKRIVQLQSVEQADVKLYKYRNAYWYAMSLFIVPYEALVLYMDAVLDPDCKNGFVLTAQERQHSVIHSAYNDSMKAQVAAHGPAATRLVTAAATLFQQSTRLLKRFAPDVVHTLVTITENKFYYDRTTDELFQALDDSNGMPVLNKIFLWHHYEELEHHMESVHLYREYYGPTARYVVPLVLPLFLLLQYTVHFVACILSVVCCFKDADRSLFVHVPFSLAHFAFDLMFIDVSSIIAAALLALGLSAKDGKVAEDLAYFRKRFHEKYGQQLANADEPLIV